MRIRDSHSTINGNKTEYVMPSGGIEIIADDGRPLFCVHQNKNGGIEISAGMVCKENGIILDDKLTITPRASNLIYINRTEYGK